jgi:hypothetical protein
MSLLLSNKQGLLYKFRGKFLPSVLFNEIKSYLRNRIFDLKVGDACTQRGSLFRSLMGCLCNGSLISSNSLRNLGRRTPSPTAQAQWSLNK